MPTRGLRGAYAKTAEQTEGRQKKRSPLYVANSTESGFVQQTPTRKAYARGDTTAYALKPTGAYAPNQDCLRKVHAVPFLYKPFHLIKKRCSHGFASALPGFAHVRGKAFPGDATQLKFPASHKHQGSEYCTHA